MAGVGTVLAIPPPGAAFGVVAPPLTVPVTFGLEDGLIVIAPAGALVGGVGDEAPAFGAGGDCVAPCAKACAAVRVRTSATAYFNMTVVSSFVLLVTATLASGCGSGNNVDCVATA